MRSLSAKLMVALACLPSTGCIFSRMFYYNFPTLSQPDYFDARVVKATAPIPLPRAEKEAVFALTKDEQKRYRSFDELLEKNLTRAFLVIKDDRIIYERYFGETTDTSLLPSFSMSKTVAALLVGCAVQDGLFHSAHDKLVTYIPELTKKARYPEITLDHLLRMTSGIDFDEESINGAMFYYSYDMRSRLFRYPVKHTPGTHYQYGSINTALLWEALHRQLGGRTVSSYFQDRVWARIGAEHDATWSLDSSLKGVEKLAGGFNATVRDQARLGLVYLHGGTLNGRTIVPEEWIVESLQPDPVPGIIDGSDGWVRRAKYQWFMTISGRAYFAKGYHGQYNFLVPDKNMLFMRFGEGYADVDWPALFLRIADGS